MNAKMLIETCTYEGMQIAISFFSILSFFAYALSRLTCFLLMTVMKAVYVRCFQILGSAQIHLADMRITKELGIAHFVGVKEGNSETIDGGHEIMGTSINGNAGPQGYTGMRHSHKHPSEERVRKMLEKKRKKKNVKSFK